MGLSGKNEAIFKSEGSRKKMEAPLKALIEHFDLSKCGCKQCVTPLLKAAKDVLNKQEGSR
ncbi:hypothetical protein LCGC14_2916560 [marine sediment metagenome]|uniref:Uncharacterized protein n=1 Tax=marine sediment metagenome TaxID=412755 RepID=A0A0F8ZXM2_9ZZZZ